MDNARFHKMEILKDHFIDYGHQIMYLPAYSNNVFQNGKIMYATMERNYFHKKFVMLEDLKIKKLYKI